MSERERRQQDKGNNPKKELESEDVFCQALALDLKQLPLYERCMAKQELRNVLYKHQMAIMERQTRSYNPYYNANQNPSNTQQPPVTLTGINRRLAQCSSHHQVPCLRHRRRQYLKAKILGCGN